MKIISVIPIHKGPGKDLLSYFSSQALAPGALVHIPLGNRIVPGLVIDCQDVTALKSSLRSSSYQLKKIKSVASKRFFSPEFIRAAQEMADYHVAPVGQIVKALTPQSVLDAVETDQTETEALAESSNLKPDIFALQQPETERLAFYRSLIREAFAKKQSVLFCLPTVPEIEAAVPELGKGIADHTIVLHGSLSKKNQLAAWRQALAADRPILLVITPGFLSIPRPDIKTVIIDRESSTAYKGRQRPFIDIREFAARYGRLLQAKTIFGDTALRTETIHALDERLFLPASTAKYRLVSTAQQKLIHSGSGDKPKRAFRALSEELLSDLEESLLQGDQAFILVNRRGLAPLTVCSDCEAIVTCSHCHSPLTVHKRTADGEGNLFVCHKCGEKQTIEDSCPRCGSWRLSLLGIGIDRVIAELREGFPTVAAYQLDSDTVTTAKKAKETVNSFLSQPGSVLVGTEMALHYLHQKIGTVAVASVDGLFTIPDFGINEKVFNLLVRCRERATKKFLIQTRHPEQAIFDQVLKGNLHDFYRQDLEERKEFSYPPYGVMIKISRTGPKADVLVEMKKLEQTLAAYEPLVYPAFTSQIKNEYRMHALVRLEAGRWPSPDLLAALKSLPPSFSIDVNPETIL
ncbi:MAG TPA: primosomal protein N' [Candidatus Paceibacterota bacterium]|nr:primosomal protein N' [Candidatus Paceibacterota bacterium]